MVRRGHDLCLTDTLHFLKITPNKTTLSISAGAYFFSSFYVKFLLFTLKCVSYEFLSLPSLKFNVSERLINM
jgi:hypothetical protein